jgi:hypothetical protein
LFNGGLGFLIYLGQFFRGNSFIELPKRMTEMVDWGIRYINVIDSELLPQRAFLLALPIGLWILSGWWQLLQNVSVSRSQLAIMGVLTGLMPLIHPHTLLSLFFVIGSWFVILIAKEKKLPSFIWWYTLPALVLGFVFSLKITASLEDSFMWVKWGWLAPDFNLFWGWFWILNWGFWLLPTIFGSVSFFRKYWQFILPFLGLFLVSNVVMFQPYDWDNSKLFTWVHLAFSGIAGAYIVRLWEKKNALKRIILVGLVVVSTASGFSDSMSLIQDIKKTSVHFFSMEEMRAAAWVRENTPSNSVFLTSDTHRHFVPVLSGRQILMGYRGWLWSYGIDYHQREAAVLAMFSGGDEATILLKKYGVDYIVVGPAEKDSFYTANVTWFKNVYPVVYESGHIMIFKTVLEQDLHSESS